MHQDLMTDATTTKTILIAAAIVGAALLIGTITTSIATTTILTGNQVFAQQQQQADSLVVQNTTTSIQDPVPGHSSHQLALAAPPRQDGKIWSGVVTFTASKPVDVVVLHPYNKPQTAATNQSFGEPLNAPNPFAPGQNIAITLMTKQTDRPIFSGSLPFAGTALAFHTTTGEPFTVTYTLDAEAKSPTTTTTGTTTDVDRLPLQREDNVTRLPPQPQGPDAMPDAIPPPDDDDEQQSPPEEEAPANSTSSN
jgi:hypothetical protein